MANETKDVEALRQRIRVLEDVLGEAYQLAGAVGAPVRVLDNLAAAAEGRTLPHDSFLPIAAEECDEVRDHPERQNEAGQVAAPTTVTAQYAVGIARASAGYSAYAPADGIGGVFGEQLLTLTRGASQSVVDTDMFKAQRAAQAHAQTLTRN